ncbi:uncharacterized protein [Drosophila tropicalis]|uniref:uncharacterized protein n=1 Tax=Drosophila tropicalis TaxID=46794 RepID=UPI0035AC1861
MSKKPCGGGINPPPIYQKLMVENLTMIRPPMLKVYFWESFDIPGLNKKLKSNRQEHEHTIVIPVRQIHSQPLKMVFWVKNLSSKEITLTLKRIQNCQCQPLQTRVGFNQFRQLFHCPHRRLIHVSQELLCIKPDEVVALTVTAYFYLYGEHYLTYEVESSDKRKFLWHFKLEISAFDLEKCLLTKELIPINIKNYHRVTQPIWVQNITMNHLPFTFSSRDRGMKLLNVNLTVPRQSVWPLLVDYRPMDYENEVEVVLTYESTKALYKVKARGVLIDDKEETDVPLNDRECADFLYVIYPNRLNFSQCLRENRTQMVNVHNYGQKCMEFRWQNYIISEFFAVTFNPSVFRLKGHHSKLCEIKVSSFDRILNFRRIPIVLEAHRILDRATQIAKAELAEIESIDDPKWKEDSYVEHVFVHLNIKTNVKNNHERDDDEPSNVGDAKSHDDISPCGGKNSQSQAAGDGATELTEEQRKEMERLEVIKRLSSKRKLTSNEVIELSMAIDQRVTIFEKLYWKYLCKTNFMRIYSDRPKHEFSKTYEEVINPNKEPTKTECTTDIDRNTVMEILTRLLQEGISDLAKNWMFIPPQYYDKPN